MRSGGQFVPPSTQGTVIFPGFDGGAEWGGAAFDAEKGLLYVNANEMPWILSMVEIDQHEGVQRLRARPPHLPDELHGVPRRG